MTARHSRRPDVPEPSDILFLILSAALLLLAGLTLGGLVAHPF